MIVAVTEQFHDYEKQKYCIDTAKLDPNNEVDALILKECKKKSLQLEVFIDATNRDDGDDIGVTQKAKVKKPKTIDRSLELTIFFDC